MTGATRRFNTPGSRNNELHVYAVNIKQSQPNNWKQLVERLNQTFNPPLSDIEVQSVINEVERRRTHA